MKKTKHFKQILLLAAAMFGLAANAQTPEPLIFSSVCSTGQALKYRVTSQQMQTVMLINIPGGQFVDIPAEVEYMGVTYRVSSIKENASPSMNYIVSLSVPWSIDTIYKRAFKNSTIDTLYFNARDCHVEWDNLNGGVWTLGSSSRHIYLGDSVKHVNSNAFRSFMQVVEELHISASVLSIGDAAFAYASLLERIVSEAVQAPVLGSDVFGDNVGDAEVLVPCGSYGSYSQSWTMFTRYLEPVDHTITLSADFPERGEAKIVQTSCSNQTAVIKAHAKYGYMFSGWNDGNTDNPRTLMLTQDTILTAHFSPLSVGDNGETAVSVYPNPTEGLFTIEAEVITAVEVFDQLGQKVMSDNSGSPTVNATSLPAGIYFLKVETATGTKYGKLMKR